MTVIDWPALMRRAFLQGFRPAEFWSLSPAEYTFLIGGNGAGEVFSRRRLDELEAAFPDIENEGVHGRDRGL